MQSDYEVSLKIQKLTRVKDGAGGKTGTPANVQTGLTATLHNYSFTSQFRIEQTPGGMTSGPGVMTQDKRLFKFLPPFPDVRVNYLLVLTSDFVLNGKMVHASGTAFNVLFVREYSRTMQVDTEIVQ